MARLLVWSCRCWRPNKRVILRTEHLSYQVAGKVIVNDVSLSVDRGEVLCVLGPSGSGKSSFLRLLNRLSEPTSGTVFLEGKNFRELPPRELRRRMGMVTQQAFLFSGTVAENIRFGPRQLAQELPDQSVSELLSDVGLAGFEPRNVSTLSGGEAQRVSIARALANEPVVLLLDEPTSALDEQSKAGIEALIRKIVQQRQLTCIMVTHDPAQARRIATQVALLRAGNLLAIGTPSEVLDAPIPS